LKDSRYDPKAREMDYEAGRKLGKLTRWHDDEFKVRGLRLDIFKLGVIKSLYAS
jgi:hypothetical protein